MEYRNNKELSTYQNASYKVKGIGDYTAEAVRQFKIVEADVSKMDLKLPETSFIWNPNGVRPEVEVPGLSSQDYKLEYFNSWEVGTARVVVTGIMNSATRKKNATGSITLEYEILPYQMQVEHIKAENTETVYNGTVQKPNVTIEGFSERGDYEVSYEKLADGVWQEAEPKEAGEYRIVVQLTDNVELIKEGEKVPNIYYINYSIRADGSGSVPGGSGSGSGSTGGNTGENTGSSGDSGSGSGSGSTGENTGSGSDSGSGSGSGSTGENTGSGSGSVSSSELGSTGENTGSSSGSGSGNTSTGSGSTGTGSGTGSSSSGNGSTATGDSNTVSEPGTSNGSSRDTTDSTAYKIKNLKLISMKKAIKIKWTKVKNAKGYQIQVSLNKKYKKAKTIYVKKSKKSYTLKKLKKNKKYYIRIRAYVSKGGRKVYGQWRTASKKTK